MGREGLKLVIRAHSEIEVCMKVTITRFHLVKFYFHHYSRWQDQIYEN